GGWGGCGAGACFLAGAGSPASRVAARGWAPPPACVARATSVADAASPEPSPPRAHDTGGPASQGPAGPDADTSARPAGSASVSVTPSATSGPLLRTSIV